MLVGSNNAGKSSVIQSLQLLHKAAGADEGVPIWLNDETSDTWFRTFGDVINIQSPEDKFSIGFNDEDTGAALLMDFGHNGGCGDCRECLWRHKRREWTSPFRNERDGILFLIVREIRSEVEFWTR